MLLKCHEGRLQLVKRDTKCSWIWSKPFSLSMIQGPTEYGRTSTQLTVLMPCS